MPSPPAPLLPKKSGFPLGTKGEGSEPSPPASLLPINRDSLAVAKGEGSSQWDYHFWFQQQGGRLGVFQGKFGSVLIDSTYNASPQSMSTVIDTVIRLRREVWSDLDLIYCLGDMRELGDFSESEHRQLASQVAQSADAVYLV